MRLDCEEDQGLVPIRVVRRHLQCHPDVSRRIENVRKMFAYSDSDATQLFPGVVNNPPRQYLLKRVSGEGRSARLGHSFRRG